MPELPDLQVYSKNLNQILKGKRVNGVKVVRPKRVHPSATALEAALIGTRIEDFRRVGKEIHILFSNKHVLGVHLMLNGAFIVAREGEEVKNVTASFQLSEGLNLYFTDRQAWIILTLDPEEPSVPDALDNEFTLQYFTAIARQKAKTPIKMLLVDQAVVQGIGNGYSDEILWHSKVDPESLSGRIPEAILKTIHDNVSKVLHEAIHQIDKHHSGITNGEPREHMAVHNKDRATSPTGYEILTKDVKGKQSFYTEEQKLYK